MLTYKTDLQALKWVGRMEVDYNNEIGGQYLAFGHGA